MLSNLIYSINAVVPVFILVILGYILKRIGFLTDEFVDVSEKLVFKVALPVMLFHQVATSSLAVVGNFSLILFCVVSVTLTFLIVSLLSMVIVRDTGKRGAFVQGTCRANVAILGVPLAENMFGVYGGQVVAITIPFVILMFNVYSVVVLTVFSQDKNMKLNRARVCDMLKNIITNPLIIGVALGLLFMLSHMDMPLLMDKSLTYVSNLTTPLALISLGANFKPANMKGRIGYAITAALGKTVLLPLIMITVGGLLGFRDVALGAILIISGTPTAVTSYIMAKKMKNDGELAAQILLLSTLFCVFTVFIGIFICKSLHLI